MNSKLLKAYRHARAEQSRRGLHVDYWPGKAAEALRIARHSLQHSKPLDFDSLPGGFSISIEIEPDYDSVPHVIEDNEISYQGRYSDHPRDYGAADGWMNRDGVSFGSDYQGDRYSAEPGKVSGYNLAQYFEDMRERGMARGPAMEQARRMAQRDADELARVLNSRASEMCGYIVTLKDADGTELDEHSCWGFDDEKYCREEAESQAAAMWAQFQKARKGDAKAARASLADLGAKVRAILAELRSVRGINAPNLCDAIRARLAELIAAHHAAARELRALIVRDRAWRAAK